MSNVALVAGGGRTGRCRCVRRGCDRRGWHRLGPHWFAVDTIRASRLVAVLETEAAEPMHMAMLRRSNSLGPEQTSLSLPPSRLPVSLDRQSPQLVETGAIALSASVSGEVDEVLSRPKFRRAISDDRRREMLERLSAAAAWLELAESITEYRDAKDNRYLMLALVAGVTLILRSVRVAENTPAYFT